ncbi:MAG: hypothetical protein IH991_12780, partial [Planctomycetes bacterium]|nr:hypothetical protein [Planctomycetota bacterium]
GGGPDNPLISEEPNNLDLTYIPDNCIAAVVVNPQRILNSKALPKDKVEPLLKMVEKEIGVDPRSVKQVVILIAEPDMGNMFGGGGGVCRWKCPINRRRHARQNVEALVYA